MRVFVGYNCFPQPEQQQQQQQKKHDKLYVCMPAYVYMYMHRRMTACRKVCLAHVSAHMHLLWFVWLVDVLRGFYVRGVCELCA